MAALGGRTADTADTPAPVTTTAAAIVKRIVTNADLMSRLPADAQGLLMRLATMDSTASLVAKVPETKQTPHRVQVSIRGQRFEMAAGTALHYFLCFYLFFALPVSVSQSQESEHGAGPTAAEIASVVAVMAKMQEKGRKDVMMVQDLCAIPTGTGGVPAELLNKLLLAHYRHTVAPCLALLLRLLRAPQTPQQQPLPPLGVPEEIVWDGSRTHWQFIFARRLPDDVAAREKCRLDAKSHRNITPSPQQQQHESSSRSSSGGGGGAVPTNFGQIYSLEPNDNPFLLLQPHFMGIVVVLARRAAQQLEEHQAGGQPTTTTRLAFPARWKELEYDAQLSLVQLVRSLGVSLLLDKFTVPTAAVSTSDFYADEDDDAVSATARADGVEDTARLPSEWGTAVDRETVDHAWVRQGCAACGMSGHPTAECPFVRKEG